MMDTSDLSNLRIDPQDREETAKQSRFWWYVLGLIVVIAIIGLIFFNGAQSVETRTISVNSIDSAQNFAILNASGYVTPRRRATIAAKITGRLVEMLVEEGMVVTEGQVLARLDSADARTNLATYRAEHEVAQSSIAELEVNLADARRNLKRYQELFSTDVVSQQQLDDAQRQVEALSARLEVARKQVIAARARVESVEQDLLNYTIVAPFAGIAVSKDAQVGEMVSPVSAGGGYTRTGIATIVDMASLEIEVDVNEAYIAKVHVGQEVTAILDAYPDWKIPARVRTIIPTADRQKATVKVRIEFIELDSKILPDMGVKVIFLDQINSSAPQEKIVTILRSALVKNDEKTYVYRVKNGVVERRAIKIGHVRGESVEVLAGLEAGDLVAVENLDKLQDGTKVKIIQ
ncbi:efflux RND transporter periplasmic adaptor subunit [bacterium]|nr:efflux RND transporter periplasmic adaptor subunit [bacterium]